MGRIPDEIVNKIIDENDIVDVISEYVSLKNSGRNFMGVCPFHSDKGPSLSVSREKQLYHCFGCGASGNVIGFIMRIKNMEFLDALRHLGERIGVSIKETQDTIENPEFKKKNLVYKVNIESARYFFQNLKRNSSAYSYFKSRGIKDNIINKFGLGYSLDKWNSLENHLKAKGFSNEALISAGIVVKGKSGTYDRFRNRVMFPVFDYKGRVIGFGGRVLNDEKPKYLNSPETPVFSKGTNLYGLNFAIKNRIPESLIIVEGYMDCISLHQAGITNVVASLGTALTEKQGKLIKKYTNNVYVCYDSDSAGQTATLRGLDILYGIGCNVKIITIPTGKDPDEFIKNNGVEKFKKLIEKALPIIDYKIYMEEKKLNLNILEDKIKLAKRACYILKSINSEIELQYYAKKISDKTGISQISIIEDIKKLKQNKKNMESQEVENVNVNNSKIEPAFKKSEQMLLALCLASKDYFSYIKGRIDVEEYISPTYKVAAKYIYDSLNEDKEIKPNAILNNFNTNHDISEASSIFSKELPDNITLSIIDNYIKIIKKYNLEWQIKNINIKIKEYEKSGEIKKSVELFKQLVLLQRQLDIL